MYVMLGLALLCGSVTVGYLTGRESSAVTEEQILDTLAKESEAPPSRSLGFAFSVVVQEGARAEGAAVTGKLAVETALDSIELSADERKLYRALGDDATGLRLRRALIAGNHESEIPGVDLYMKNFLADLFRNPGAGSSAVKTGLSRMPASDFPLERAALLTALAAVPEKAEEAKSLALDEMTNHVVEARQDPAQAKTEEELDRALTTTPSMLLPIAAHAVFLKTSKDPSESLQATTDAIVAQPDTGIRTTIVAQFVQAHPELEPQLANNLRTKGIQLPDSQPPVVSSTVNAPTGDVASPPSPGGPPPAEVPGDGK